MFKKIKAWFSLQKTIQIETMETLCTICLYLNAQGHYKGNPYAEYLPGHFRALKLLSEELRGTRNENH